MEAYICVTCGTQFAASDQPPEHCPICEDERQYLPSGDQQWTNSKTHRNSFLKKAPRLYGIGTVPDFDIGQWALLIQTSQGNVLWDGISPIDDATLDFVRGLGGLSAIAI